MLGRFEITAWRTFNRVLEFRTLDLGGARVVLTLIRVKDFQLIYENTIRLTVGEFICVLGDSNVRSGGGKCGNYYLFFNAQTQYRLSATSQPNPQIIIFPKRNLTPTDPTHLPPPPFLLIPINYWNTHHCLSLRSEHFFFPT